MNQRHRRKQANARAMHRRRPKPLADFPGIERAIGYLEAKLDREVPGWRATPWRTFVVTSASQTFTFSKVQDPRRWAPS